VLLVPQARPYSMFPYDQNDIIVPQPKKRREWIQQVLKDLEESEQGTEEQLNQFKYLVMKRLIRSEKYMEEVTKKNIDALRQEVTQLLEQLNKKL
jgi:glucuronate isomerase